MTVLIFANGDLERGAWLDDLLASAAALVAADGGSEHLRTLDIRPDLVVGDFDSVSATTLAWLQDGEVALQRVPAEKDETDLELALLAALERWADDIVILAGLGGRFDQTFANISLLGHPAARERTVMLRTRREQIRYLGPGRHTLRGAPGDRLSLLPFGEPVRVRATTGLKWALRDNVLAFGPARGVSNLFSAETVTLDIVDGYLLAIQSERGWER